jgi:hypothetical protein
MHDVAIAAVYAFAFGWLCWDATRQGTTVWVLLGRAFSDIGEAVFGAVGFVPRPAATRRPRLSYARIRQLERELGFDDAADKGKQP